MKHVVLLSGGMDSTVLLANLAFRGREAWAVAVNYGQRHRREIEAARLVADYCGVPIEVIDLPVTLLAGSAITGDLPVPHGHYEAESMRETVVPNRNMLLLAIGGAVAVRERFDAVSYAAHAGDHAIYPDCRAEFAAAMSSALALCHYTQIALDAPFIRMSKAEVAALGRAVCAPLHLSWSCYEGGDLHCGRCGTCVERKEAFVLAGVPDPTEYAA